MTIKIDIKELRGEAGEKLLLIKKKLILALLNKNLYSVSRGKNLSSREIKKNIARINTILSERRLKENG